MVKTPHDYPIYGNPIMSFKCFIINIKSEDCCRQQKQTKNPKNVPFICVMSTQTYAVWG